jgi:hypothetical protein
MESYHYDIERVIRMRGKMIAFAAGIVVVLIVFGTLWIFGVGPFTKKGHKTTTIIFQDGSSIVIDGAPSMRGGNILSPSREVTISPMGTKTLIKELTN